MHGDLANRISNQIKASMAPQSGGGWMERTLGKVGDWVEEEPAGWIGMTESMWMLGRAGEEGDTARMGHDQ